jgi:Icc-related predicted phosphoesterase
LPKIRIIFSSDFHGSDVVWRKFLNSASMFNANVLLMGGDMTSKVMVPIVRETEGDYTANFLGKHVKISEEGLPELKKQIRQHCYLAYVCSKAEVEKLSQDQDYVEKVFEDLEIEMVKDWLSLIPKKAPDAKVIIHPGNDDKLVLDDVLKSQWPIWMISTRRPALDGQTQPLGTAHESAPRNNSWRSWRRQCHN